MPRPEFFQDARGASHTPFIFFFCIKKPAPVLFQQLKAIPCLILPLLRPASRSHFIIIYPAIKGLTGVVSLFLLQRLFKLEAKLLALLDVFREIGYGLVTN